MTTHKLVQVFIVFVGISGVFSVLFGAWLSHGGAYLPINQQNALGKALQFQFIHTLALLAVLVWFFIQPIKWLLVTCLSFSLGILFFSGGIYLKVLLGWSFVSKLTPLGGVLFALGWAFIVICAKDINKKA